MTGPAESTMEVNLDPTLDEFVAQLVADGVYPSRAEVISEGLRLLREREVEQQRHLESLRRDIAIGLEQAARGQTKPLNDAAVERIKARGRERLRPASSSFVCSTRRATSSASSAAADA